MLMHLRRREPQTLSDRGRELPRLLAQTRGRELCHRTCRRVTEFGTVPDVVHGFLVCIGKLSKLRCYVCGQPLPLDVF